MNKALEHQEKLLRYYEETINNIAKGGFQYLIDIGKIKQGDDLKVYIDGKLVKTVKVELRNRGDN